MPNGDEESHELPKMPRRPQVEAAPRLISRVERTIGRIVEPMNSVDGQAVEASDESTREGLDAGMKVETAKVGSHLNELVSPSLDLLRLP